jgi:hypothetical protein
MAHGCFTTYRYGRTHQGTPYLIGVSQVLTLAILALFAEQRAQ